MSQFKYDIAISFLKEDEQLAINISNKINGKFDVFIYSKRQEDLAGTDGQNTFSEIFKSTAGTVLVLYRKKWGNTKWTKVEETAIKDRWFNQGHDFLLFVPIEEAELPIWFPETMIYYDFKTFKLDGLPPVIYNHLKRNGAEEKKTSLEATIEKIDTDKKYKEELKSYLRSEEAIQDFKNQIQKMISFIEDKVEEINNEFEKINLVLKESRERYIVRYGGYELNFYYRQIYQNSLKDSDILFRIYKGYNVTYNPPDRQPKKIGEERYLMTKDRIGNIVWKAKSDHTYIYNQLLEDKFEELFKLGN